jgi:hypothetical protein
MQLMAPKLPVAKMSRHNISNSQEVKAAASEKAKLLSFGLSLHLNKA